MPTYEYGCEACGKTWELEQRITEAAVKECPKCGKLEARRLISGGTFMLKGGGWYADGYGSKSSPKSDAAKTDGKGETKADAKPDAKSDGGGKTDGGAKSESKAESKPSTTSGAAD